MVHKRIVQPTSSFENDGLTSAMIGIGMMFGGKASQDPNIEDTLLAAAIAGMEEDDLRVLSVLTTWFGMHSNYVIASRLVRIAKACENSRVRAYFSAIAAWLRKDHRFDALKKLQSSERVDLLHEGTDFLIQRRGEDPRFDGGPLRVPKGTLRDRPKDVLSPAALAQQHNAYYWRVVIGPSFRADMWAALQSDGGLTATKLARKTYGSYSTAWKVRREAELVSTKSVIDRNHDGNLDH